jgi:hypothetical protein
MSIDLSNVTLGTGSHDGKDGVCLLEATALFAGELKTDQPSCVSPVIRSYGVRLNDRMPDEWRQQLTPFIKRMIGTAGDGHDQERAYLAADYAVRKFAPLALEARGFMTQAETLRNLSPIVDVRTANAAAYAAAVYAAAADAAAADAAADADAAYAANAAAYAAAYAADAAYAANAADVVWPLAIELFDKLVSMGE